MIYKIKTDNTIWDEDIEEMLRDPKNQKIHGFYKYLQQAIKINDEVTELHLDDINSETFYKNFVSASLPAHVVDGCAKWPAMEKDAKGEQKWNF